MANKKDKRKKIEREKLPKKDKLYHKKTRLARAPKRHRSRKVCGDSDSEILDVDLKACWGLDTVIPDCLAPETARIIRPHEDIQPLEVASDLETDDEEDTDNEGNASYAVHVENAKLFGRIDENLAAKKQNEDPLRPRCYKEDHCFSPDNKVYIPLFKEGRITPYPGRVLACFKKLKEYFYTVKLDEAPKVRKCKTFGGKCDMSKTSHKYTENGNPDNMSTSSRRTGTAKLSRFPITRSDVHDIVAEPNKPIGNIDENETYKTKVVFDFSRWVCFRYYEDAMFAGRFLFRPADHLEIAKYLANYVDTDMRYDKLPRGALMVKNYTKLLRENKLPRRKRRKIKSTRINSALPGYIKAVNLTTATSKYFFIVKNPNEVLNKCEGYKEKRWRTSQERSEAIEEHYDMKEDRLFELAHTYSFEMPSEMEASPPSPYKTSPKHLPVPCFEKSSVAEDKNPCLSFADTTSFETSYSLLPGENMNQVEMLIEQKVSTRSHEDCNDEQDDQAGNELHEDCNDEQDDQAGNELHEDCNDEQDDQAGNENESDADDKDNEFEKNDEMDKNKLKDPRMERKPWSTVEKQDSLRVMLGRMLHASAAEITKYVLSRIPQQEWGETPYLRLFSVIRKILWHWYFGVPPAERKFLHSQEFRTACEIEKQGAGWEYLWCSLCGDEKLYSTNAFLNHFQKHHSIVPQLCVCDCEKLKHGDMVEKKFSYASEFIDHKLRLDNKFSPAHLPNLPLYVIDALSDAAFAKSRGHRMFLSIPAYPNHCVPRGHDKQKGKHVALTTVATSFTETGFQRLPYTGKLYSVVTIQEKHKAKSVIHQYVHTNWSCRMYKKAVGDTYNPRLSHRDSKAKQDDDDLLPENVTSETKDENFKEKSKQESTVWIEVSDEEESAKGKCKTESKANDLKRTWTGAKPNPEARNKKTRDDQSSKAMGKSKPKAKSNKSKNEKVVTSATNSTLTRRRAKITRESIVANRTRSRKRSSDEQNQPKGARGWRGH